MTKKEIEAQLKTITDGAVFISPKDIAKAMGTSRPEKIRFIYATLPKVENTSKYFIPDVAESIFNHIEYR